MATERTSSWRRLRRREPDLRPARWPARPGAVTVLRATLVAAFLALAAGLIYTQEPVTCAGSAPSAGNSSGPTRDEQVDTGRADPAAGAEAPAPGGSGRPLPIPRGLVGLPVRLGEPAAAAAVRPGGRVDLLAVPIAAARPTAEQPTVLASAALVLDVLTGGGDAPAALVLALDPAQARRAVGQPDTTRFAVVLR